MLALRPNCECCDRDLPPESRDALICSFECTWCSECATTHMGNHCANCFGELQPRPIRRGDMLAKFPAATERKFQPGLAERLRGQNCHDLDLIGDDRPMLEEPLQFRRAMRICLSNNDHDLLDRIYGPDTRPPGA